MMISDILKPERTRNPSGACDAPQRLLISSSPRDRRLFIGCACLNAGQIKRRKRKEHR